MRVPFGIAIVTRIILVYAAAPVVGGGGNVVAV